VSTLSRIDREPLLFVDDLRKSFDGESQGFAVDGVSLAVRRGETFGLVGETGSGKSTLARCVVRLLKPTEGRVVFDGHDLSLLRARELRAIRRRLQMVFQDGSASLNSHMTVEAIVEEPLKIHGVRPRDQRRIRAAEMLDRVGITSQQRQRKPHALSGGQRQRVGIARALVLCPDLVVLDEPVSAVDVSIQAQILNLLADLQDELRLTYLLIVHDLAVAERVCDRVAVLYLGRVMEVADREALFRRPLHPYTVTLLSAVPIPDPRIEARRKRVVLDGDVNVVDAQQRGCAFRFRCPIGQGRKHCMEERPALVDHGGGHVVACHYAGEFRAD